MRRSFENTRTNGLTQVLKYANRCDLVEASLEIAVGAIPSGEQPVYGTGKETWDGVCLMMIVSKQWSEPSVRSHSAEADG
jgi:hypothetical protein